MFPVSGAGSESVNITWIPYEAIVNALPVLQSGYIRPNNILEFGPASNVLAVTYTLDNDFSFSTSDQYHLYFVLSSWSQAKYLAVSVWVDDGNTELTAKDNTQVVSGTGLLYHAEPNTFSTEGGTMNIDVTFTSSVSGALPLKVTVINRNFGGSDTGYYGFGYKSCTIETVDRDENIITRITNNISNFLSDLWNSISNWFDEHLIQPIQNWWQGILDWFELNFTIPDGYFDTWRDGWEQWLSDHFGFLYDAGTLISDVFTSIMDVFSGESPNTLEIPQVKLPEILGGAVLIEAQTFDFDEFVDSIPALATIYGIYVTCMYGAALFAIIKLGQNTLEEILTDRQVTD